MKNGELRLREQMVPPFVHIFRYIGGRRNYPTEGRIRFHVRVREIAESRLKARLHWNGLSSQVLQNQLADTI